MGLENLKSVFNQGVGNAFKPNSPNPDSSLNVGVGNVTSQPDGGIAKAPTDLNFDTLFVDDSRVCISQRFMWWLCF